MKANRNTITGLCLLTMFLLSMTACLGFEQVLQLGESRDGESGTTRPVSKKFGTNELHRLYTLLNSKEFQAALTNYNCGDPVPKLTFMVMLEPETSYSDRLVGIDHWPGLSPAGRTRGLLFGLDYLIDKAVAKIDPDPPEMNRMTREPHCDCTNRDSGKEWVTFPGPDEVLAPLKPKPGPSPELEIAKVDDSTVIGLVPAPAPVSSAGKPLRLVTHEESLGKLPSQEAAEKLMADATLSHVAYTVKRGTKEVVVVDGAEGRECDGIPNNSEMTFSPDGKHFAYVAKRGNKTLVVVDGKEGKEYDSVYDLFTPVFSPDSKHVAYIASTRAFDWPPFKQFIVLDGKEGKGYGSAMSPVFSPDSQRVAYLAERKWNRGMCVVVNGVEGKQYDQITSVTFSPDSRRLAYEVYERTNRSPESLGNDFVIIDGVEKKQYFQSTPVRPARFSPDSKHTVYTVGAPENIVVLDDVPGKSHGRIGSVCFSPDSKHVAFTAYDGDKWRVFVDEKPIYAEGVNEYTQPFFSPDGRLAYTGKAETNLFLVVGGVVSKPSGSVASDPVFSPDGKCMAYWVNRGEKCAPVINGLEGKEYDRFIMCDQFRNNRGEGSRFITFSFDEAGSLHTIALRGNEILRLEFKILEE